MVDLANRLPEGAGIVSTVHDELIVEAPEHSVEKCKTLVTQCMEAAMKRLFPNLPVQVAVKDCANWGEKK
jgi:DNA polymerase I-like protein with 3'-5' exonuclease and polymerase domains